MERTSLDGRTAIVTGGARGIGRASCVELARAGAKIVFCDRAESGDETIAAVREAGSEAIYVRGDVSDRGQMEQLFAAAPRVDVLVNNAAINIRKPMVELECDDVRKVWDVILWGTFHCSQLAARRMIEQGEGGSIIMISSVHAYRPFPLSTSYNGAKAAVNHMAATWAAELAPHRIRVNSIEPGWIDTPGERTFYTEEQIQKEGENLPWGRLGRPEEIARAVRFLATGESSYVTGSVLRVDGGIVLPR
ncbi:MAG: SDR family oxidoreductase [Bryobacteraceae bacterium]